MLRKRYRRILFFFARIILGVIFWEIISPKIGLGGLSQRNRSERMRKIAVAYRSLAIQMGGVLIKVGQFLSTRLDVLPIEITDILAGLQDEVPSESFADIRQLAEVELGSSLENKFAWFDEQPLAAASLGQVHRARLHEPEDGIDDVVVKIQRPNIENIVKTDMSALRVVGGWLNRYPPLRKRANIPGIIQELDRSLLEEVDYLSEAEYAEMFAMNFRDDPGVRVPVVLWALTTRRVLTLENVSAIKITDYEAIETAGVDRMEVAQRLLRTYLKQIFEDGFFHADPHPGNLFVEPGTDGKDWRLVFIDFGMVGHVQPNMLTGLREMIIGAATQDAKRMVRSYQMIGVLLPTADLSLLEKAEAKLFERFWGKTMDELRQISYSELEVFAEEFRELLYTLPFQIPQDLIWIGRTVAILSGMCTGLDQNFNVWESISPFAQKLVTKERLTGWAYWSNELLQQLRLVVSLPRRVDRAIGLLERGELEVNSPAMEGQTRRLEAALRRVSGGLVFGALLLGGIQLHLAGETLFSQVVLAGALVVFLWMVFSRR